MYVYTYRRKFRSQTSYNMDRWKAEQGKGREKRKIRREKIRRERVRRQKIQMREKVGKSRNTVFFHWFVAPEGRKVGLLKRRCGASWPQERWKIARRCGAKHISKSKCTKHTILGPLLEVAMSKKCTPLWREAHFQVKKYKTHHSRTTSGSWDVKKVHTVVAPSTCRCQHVNMPHARTTFGGSDVVLRGRRRGLCTLSEVSKTWGFCGMSKNNLQAWDIWRGSAKMHFPWQAQYKRHVHQRCRRSGRCFPERGCILEHQIFRFAEMIFCVTGAALRMTQYHFFVAGAIIGQVESKNRKTHCGTKPSALHSTFHFLKEVSQNCFVFDIVNFEKWGSLAEVLRFWRCQVENLRKSRWIAAFFDVAKFKN